MELAGTDMNRRGFFAAFAAIAAAATLDPERLLWVPGRKLISIPSVFDLSPVVITAWRGAFRVGDVVTFGRDPSPYTVISIGPPYHFACVRVIS